MCIWENAQKWSETAIFKIHSHNFFWLTHLFFHSQISANLKLFKQSNLSLSQKDNNIMHIYKWIAKRFNQHNRGIFKRQKSTWSRIVWQNINQRRRKTFKNTLYGGSENLRRYENWNHFESKYVWIVCPNEIFTT